jgi:hypothetical protein
MAIAVAVLEGAGALCVLQRIRRSGKLALRFCGLIGVFGDFVVCVVVLAVIELVVILVLEDFVFIRIRVSRTVGHRHGRRCLCE